MSGTTARKGGPQGGSPLKSGEFGAPVSNLGVHRSRRAAVGDQEMGRPASIKFTDADFQCLEGLAWWEQTTVTETIRVAMLDYFARRIASPTIHDEIRAARERDAKRAAELYDAAMADDASGLKLMPPREQKPNNYTKPITVRLSAHYINKLTGFALIDDNTMVDQIRRAVDEHLDRTLTVPREDFLTMIGERHNNLRDVVRPVSKETKQMAAAGAR